MATHNDKPCLLMSVFLTDEFTTTQDFVFRSKESAKLSSAIEFYIEKFMSVIQLKAQAQAEGSSGNVWRRPTQSSAEEAEEILAGEEAEAALARESEVEEVVAIVDDHDEHTGDFGFDQGDEQDLLSMDEAPPPPDDQSPYGHSGGGAAAFDPFAAAPAPAPAAAPPSAAVDPFFAPAAPAPAPAPAAAADPFGMDSFAAPAPAPAPVSFDPFAPAAGAAPQQQQQQQNGGFDQTAFGGPPTNAPAPAPPFDPFAAADGSGMGMGGPTLMQQQAQAQAPPPAPVQQQRPADYDPFAEFGK